MVQERCVQSRHIYFLCNSCLVVDFHYFAVNIFTLTILLPVCKMFLLQIVIYLAVSLFFFLTFLLISVNLEFLFN